MQRRLIKPLSNLVVTLVQTDIVWQNREANWKNIEDLLGQVGAGSTDVVILPEMFTSGFTLDSVQHAELENGPTTDWLRRQAKRLNAVVTGSIITRCDVRQGTGDAMVHSYRNRLLWAQPDGQVLHYDKRHLFRMGGEHEHFDAGTKQVVFEYKGWRIRPLICYDLRFPAWSCDAETTDLLLYVASWPTARLPQWTKLLLARGIENSCYVAGVNRLGVDGRHLAYAGGSQVSDFLGNTILPLDDKNGAYSVELSAKQLEEYRTTFPVLLDADAFSLEL